MIFQPFPLPPNPYTLKSLGYSRMVRHQLFVPRSFATPPDCLASVQSTTTVLPTTLATTSPDGTKPAGQWQSTLGPPRRRTSTIRGRKDIHRRRERIRSCEREFVSVVPEESQSLGYEYLDEKERWGFVLTWIKALAIQTPSKTFRTAGVNSTPSVARTRRTKWNRKAR